MFAHVTASRFHMVAEAFPYAHAALRSLHLPRGDKAPLSFRDVDPNAVLNAQDLPTAMKAWRWTPTVSQRTGNIVRITFKGGEWLDDRVLFKTLGPYVTKGSHISLIDDQKRQWIWEFDGNTANGRDLPPSPQNYIPSPYA